MANGDSCVTSKGGGLVTLWLVNMAVWLLKVVACTATAGGCTATEGGWVATECGVATESVCIY